MKLILSRKGTDSSAGGLPSPILPDGRLLSLPIPQSDGPLQYSALQANNQSLSSLIKHLGGKQWRSGCHLDPDIDASLLADTANWLPAFGQSGAAQRHLEQEGVGQGDLFLFFGWFRQTKKVKGKLQFVKGAPDIHLLYGWLQVGEILRPRMDVGAGEDEPFAATPEQILSRYPQLAQHPHLKKDYPFNCLYLPTETLRLNGEPTDVAGYGMFPGYRPELQLTTAGENRTHWTLPQVFFPSDFDRALSYHRQPWRWQDADSSLNPGKVHLQAAARGQEFVLELDVQPEVTGWIRSLF